MNSPQLYVMAHKHGSHFPILEQRQSNDAVPFLDGKMERDTYDTVLTRSKQFMAHLSVMIWKSFVLSECVNLSRIMPQSREEFPESQMLYQSCFSPLNSA